MDSSTNESDRPFPMSGTVTDLRTLDCLICFNPLTIPTYQCLNGHVVCSECWPQLEGRCPTCKEGLYAYRCLAVEKILECLTVRCPNEEVGCNEIVLYQRLRKHLNDDCIGSPCFCPQTCDFKGTSKEVYFHYIKSHSIPRMTMTEKMFSFRKSKDVVLGIVDNVSVIYSFGTHALFVLQCFRNTDGLHIDISMIASVGVEGKFPYRISYTHRGDTIVHQSPNVKRVFKISRQTQPVGRCCHIPNHMFTNSSVAISLTIWRV